MEKVSTIINSDEKYLMPAPDQVRFASEGQTLSLVLGSCISTVFIARSDRYILSANHIMIARERHSGIIAKKSARMQIDEILDTLHDENISETRKVLSEKSITPLFDDTRSYYFATYSLSGHDMSVFIEDKLGNSHLSYIIDLQKLFSLDLNHLAHLPASALKPCNLGFEDFVAQGAIVFITGERNRPNV